ncbi:MAG: hypothetical protein Q8O33_09670 [Pseudomonadota bacterium]|nr:hypothetical protein [Pseudomonadota bacterium]
MYFTKYGLQAKRYFGVDLPLEVLKSNAGFYIGTFNHEDGPEWGPCSRESEEYYKTESAAGIALAEGLWTQRLEP